MHFQTGLLHRIRRVGAATFVTGSLAIFGSSLVWGVEPTCPTENSEQFPFDSSTVIFDSVHRNAGDGFRIVSDCVKIEHATHEYVIDWTDAGIENIGTRNGSLSSVRKIDGAPSLKESIAYVGVNRRKMTPHALEEMTFVTAVKKSLETYLVGALSTVARTRSDRESYLKPVELRFVASNQGNGVVSLKYENAAFDGTHFSFTFGSDMSSQFKELAGEFAFTKEGVSIVYKANADSLIGRRALITLRNSDHQDIGAFAIDILVPRPR